MAIYHLHVKNIGRRDGRSAVAAAAYRAGEVLPNAAEERDSAFGGRRDVVCSEIRLPAGAPAWMADRARLWNAAEAAEKRRDARLAKEIEFALPRELPQEAWLLVAQEMADAYTARGHVVDLAVHDDGTADNPHVHLMLTTRQVERDGFGPKLRAADGTRFVIEARELWEKIANAALGKVGSAVQVDARSYSARGIERSPTRHRGPNPAARLARRSRLKEESMRDDRAPRDEPSLVGDVSDVFPVPGPDGGLLSPRELDMAQREMLAEVEQPAVNVPQPPHPTEAPEVERIEAEAANDRLAELPVPEEPFRFEPIASHEEIQAWLRSQIIQGQSQPPRAAREEKMDRLAWMRDEIEQATEEVRLRRTRKRRRDF